ncbi:LytR C-terminal domain-containing protein [Phytomonospora sp. NPDC050363]|uniref:LytR C-terminal domain-containing protein n=1 Tax=Phytomonospora sp. NPDC050363 TaxID=3155642 RepID=UPI0033DDC276
MRLARVRALIIVGVLALVATATAGWAILNDSQADLGGCASDKVRVSLEMPEPKDVEVRVFNGTGEPGLAEQVKGDLEEYGYKVVKVGNKKRDDLEVSAEVRFGPQAVGAGHVLSAYFLDSARKFDPERDDAVVDVIIGTGFRQVNTESEKVQSLGEIGRPTAPTGTCPINP